MKSMTGFGRGEYVDDEYEIVVEMKSINHRYRDYFIRMPRQISMLEENIRKYLNRNISRGRIEVNIKVNCRELMEDKSIKLNSKLASEYIDCLKEIKDNFPEVSGEISLSLISKFPDIITCTEDQVDIEQIWQKILPALEVAVDKVVESRENEGNNLREDFNKRLKSISDGVKRIERQAPKVSEDYRRRLEDRIREFVDSVEIDEDRLLNEVAIFADKVSIDEEITRLKSHIHRFADILEESEPVGRKLDFLIQEMNREINTIGSKSNDIEIANGVVDVKSELEKMREQVQNIE